MKHYKVTKDSIKSSGINKLPLEQLEDEFSSKRHHTHPSGHAGGLVISVGIIGTVAVLLLIFGGSYTLYTAIYGTENRLGMVGLSQSDQNKQDESTEQTNPKCQKNSNVPVDACQAILSIENDRTATNKSIGARVIPQLESLASPITINIYSDSWTKLSEDSASVYAEAVNPISGRSIISLKLNFAGSQWLVSELEIEQEL